MKYLQTSEMKKLNAFLNGFPHFILISMIISVFIVSTIGCRNDPDLTPTERRMADSIFRVRSNEIVPRFDSICDSVYNQSYPVIVDSLKKVRQEEIIKLLED